MYSIVKWDRYDGHGRGAASRLVVSGVNTSVPPAHLPVDCPAMGHCRRSLPRLPPGVPAGRIAAPSHAIAPGHCACGALRRARPPGAEGVVDAGCVDAGAVGPSWRAHGPWVRCGVRLAWIFLFWPAPSSRVRAQCSHRVAMAAAAQLPRHTSSGVIATGAGAGACLVQPCGCSPDDT